MKTVALFEMTQLAKIGEEAGPQVVLPPQNIMKFIINHFKKTTGLYKRNIYIMRLYFTQQHINIINE